MFLPSHANNKRIFFPSRFSLTNLLCLHHSLVHPFEFDTKPENIYHIYLVYVRFHLLIYDES
jgi:hypothetical protein